MEILAPVYIKDPEKSGRWKCVEPDEALRLRNSFEKSAKPGEKFEMRIMHDYPVKSWDTDLGMDDQLIQHSTTKASVADVRQLEREFCHKLKP